MSAIAKYAALAVATGYVINSYASQYSLGFVATSSIAFIITILSRFVWNGSIYPYYFSPLRDIPMVPNGDFVLGHTRAVMKDFSGVPQRRWMSEVENDGMLRYVNWMRERVLITNTKVLKEVLMTKSYDFVKPRQIRHGLARLLGRGVLFAEGDEHRVQRKNLTPAFAFRHIKDLYPIFWEKAGDLVEALSEASRDATLNPVVSGTGDDSVKHSPGAFEISSWISRSTLDIIGVSGMDRDFNALRDPDNELSRQYQNVLNPSKFARYLAILAFVIPRSILDRIPIKDNQNIWSAADYVKRICRDMILKKRQAMAEKKATRPDIISIALTSGSFDDEELVNQMMTFLIAGHETTASAMAWAMYLVCKHPEIQINLRKAVRDKIPSLRSDITTAQIDECHYLNAFCSEVLRLWPPVLMTLRVAAKDTTLNGHFIPEDTVIIIAPNAINASTAIWGADAEEFGPERWLDADGRANNSGGAESAYSFLTFLHGPRACIGQRFAEAEFACLVASIVGRFEIRLEEGSLLTKGPPEIKGGVTSRPKGGVWVHLKEIGSW